MGFPLRWRREQHSMATLACWIYGQAARDTCPSPLGMPVSGPLPSMKPNRAVFQDGMQQLRYQRNIPGKQVAGRNGRKAKGDKQRCTNKGQNQTAALTCQKRGWTLQKGGVKMVGAVNSGQSGSSLVTGSYAERKIGVQDSRSRELQIG